MRLRTLGAIVAVLCIAAFSVHGATATNAISLAIELAVNNGELEVEMKPGASQINMAGDSISDIVQGFTVGATSLVTIASGVGTYGVAMIRALWTNESHYIEFGPISIGATNFYPIITLKSAEVSAYRMHTTNAIYGHAVGASLNARITVVED